LNECGTCCNWMIKRLCIREANGTFVNAGMWACDDYQEQPWFTKLKLERGR